MVARVERCQKNYVSSAQRVWFRHYAKKLIMFGIKTQLAKMTQGISEKMIFPQHTFDERVPFYRKIAFLTILRQQLEQENQYCDVQMPMRMQSHPVFIPLNWFISTFMPNNLGNWSLDEPDSVSSRIEQQVIKYMVGKYHESFVDVGGYLTSGATEGNLYLLWMGRDQLNMNIPIERLVVMKTDLTHYSVSKAAQILHLECSSVTLDPNIYSISKTDLRKKILQLYSQGKRGFLLSVTLGYTVTGTNDDLAAVLEVANELQQQKKDLRILITIDAAFSGVINPFLLEDWRPLQDERVLGIVADFHKYWRVPFPAGLVLYRKKYSSGIEQSVSYIGKKDTTVLGSRPGSTALRIWYLLFSLGESGLRKSILFSLKKKKQYIQKIKKQFPTVSVVSGKYSTHLGLVANTKKDRDSLEQTGLRCDGVLNVDNKKKYVFKIFFL